ncbi:Alanine--tRNA ligase [Morella rubra]|uniref:Alanine--tRNA ligase n=1 Tax=Morella rubra TaxID=262757 RepID=A0A6A1VYM8_9ROSI|nr:Alanine--tRNA ligase [Morella rubra]
MLRLEMYGSEFYHHNACCLLAAKTISGRWVILALGGCPGNEGREYVLRRILCRAVRYGSEVLKAQEGFFNGLVNVVVKVMGGVFPELKQNEERIRDIIAEEETSFGKTLLKGIEKFKKAAQDVQGKILSG